MRGWQLSGRAGRRATAVAAAAFTGVALIHVPTTPPASAQASPKVFTVGNYPVEARAADAVTARSRAVADGQRAALRSLIKRLVPVTAYARVRTLQLPNPASLVESTSVRSERNSTTDYIASLDFAYQPQAIRSLLDREGIPYVDQQAPAVTVVPIWRAPADSSQMPAQYGPTDGPRSWTDAWKGLDLDHALAPVKLATLKPEVPADVVKALAAGDGAQWSRFAAAYGNTTLLVAAIAEPDVANRKLKVVLIGADATGAIAWSTAYRIDIADPGYAVELAGVVSLRVFEGRWKAVNANGGPPSPPVASAAPAQGGFGPSGVIASPTTPAAGGVIITVEFRGMGEWQDISRRLSATPGVENLDVLGLSGRSARVSLNYAGGPQRLADALAAEGITMRRGGQGWVIAAR